MTVDPGRLKYDIEIAFACRDLVDLDLVTKTDPFLKVYEQKGGQWTCLGQTEVVYNNLNPEFNKRFKVDFYFEDIQPFKVEIYHFNSEKNTVKIGEVEFNLSNLTGNKNNVLEKEIIDTVGKKPKRGFLLARYDEVSKGVEVNLQITGRNIKNVVFCGSNKNFYEIHKPRNPITLDHFVKGKKSDFDYCKSDIPDEEWTLVYRSENFLKNDEVNWASTKLQKGALCAGIDTLPLRITVHHYAKDSGNHKLIGGAIATFAELQAFKAGCKPIELKDKSGKGVGHLVVSQFNINTKYTFVDYIKGGLNISLIIGVDFTGSNGLPTNENSLHRRYPQGSDKMNPYQQAILKGAEVLLEYDTDKMVPVYGFGATLKFPGMSSTATNHCFPCSGSNDQEEAYGIDGIFGLYNNALDHVELNGPTLFSPILQHIINIANTGSVKNPDNYYFFMILTDGQIDDMGQTMNLIVQACKYPLSIVIVGIGNNNFGNMDILDTGNFSSQGVANPTRDICRFVHFSKYQNNLVELRREMLAEIPSQIEEYFAINKIAPKPPVSASNFPSINGGGNAMIKNWQAGVDPTGLNVNFKAGNMNYPELQVTESTPINKNAKA